MSEESTMQGSTTGNEGAAKQGQARSGAAGQPETPPAGQEQSGDQDKNPRDQAPAQSGGAVSFTPEQEAAIGRMLDQRAHKLGNRVKQLEGQLASRDKALSEKMTAEELRQLELDEMAAQLEQSKAEFQVEQRQRFATEAIVAAGLGQSSDHALRLRDYVMAETEEEIQSRVEGFKKLIEEYTAAAVQQRFRVGGRVPPKGGGPVLSDYQKQAQAAMAAGNPAQAARLLRMAGQENGGIE